MLKINIQLKAKKDLKDIYSYTYESFGEEQADIYFNKLNQQIEILKANPEIGIPCDYIRSSYRQLHINKHIVFYKVTSIRIHVIRILHERMHQIKHFKGDFGL